MEEKLERQGNKRSGWRRKFLVENAKMPHQQRLYIFMEAGDGKLDTIIPIIPWWVFKASAADNALFSIFFAADTPEEFIIKAGLEGYAKTAATAFVRGLTGQKIAKRLALGWLSEYERGAVREIQRMALKASRALRKDALK